MTEQENWPYMVIFLLNVLMAFKIGSSRSIHFLLFGLGIEYTRSTELFFWEKMKCCSLYRYLTIHSGPSVMGTELCFPQLSTISLFDGNNQFKVLLAIIGQLKCGLTVHYRPKPTSFSKSKPSISILS